MFSDEEIDGVRNAPGPVAPDGAILSRAAARKMMIETTELLASRGAPLSAEAISSLRKENEQLDAPWQRPTLSRMFEHMSYLGARIAVLETTLATAQHEVARTDAVLRVVAPDLIAVLTSSCAWCGQEAPQGMQPGDVKEYVRAHVRTCSEHPMRVVEKRLEEARSSLLELAAERNAATAEAERLKGREQDLEQAFEKRTQEMNELNQYLDTLRDNAAARERELLAQKEILEERLTGAEESNRELVRRAQAAEGRVETLSRDLRSTSEAMTRLQTERDGIQALVDSMANVIGTPLLNRCRELVALEKLPETERVEQALAGRIRRVDEKLQALREGLSGLMRAGVDLAKELGEPRPTPTSLPSAQVLVDKARLDQVRKHVRAVASWMPAISDLADVAHGINDNVRGFLDRMANIITALRAAEAELARLPE